MNRVPAPAEAGTLLKEKLNTWPVAVMLCWPE
jgi:hypothetical protein